MAEKGTESHIPCAPPAPKTHPSHSGAHHHRLEDLCGNGRQHPLVIVLPDAGENAWQLAGHWPEEDAQRDVHVLQICGGHGWQAMSRR